MSKYKHNKKRNTAFLYEVLLLEMAKTIISNNVDQRQKILIILKEFFAKNTILSQELKLFKNLETNGDVDQFSAEKILIEVKKMYAMLDQNKLFDSQNDLIRQMKNLFGVNIFSNFVPNYKSLASISQIFNKDIAIKTRVLLENGIVSNMSNQLLAAENKMTPINNLVLNSFVSKFNSHYSVLLKEQKELMQKYILSSIDNGLEFKIYLNEEIARLKRELSKAFLTEKNEIMSSKIKSIEEQLKDYSTKEKLHEDDIIKLLKIQNLIKEINSNDS